MPEIDKNKDWDKPEGGLPLDPKVAMMMTRRETNALTSQARVSPAPMALNCKCGGNACTCNELAEALAYMILYIRRRHSGSRLLIQGALRAVRSLYSDTLEMKAERIIKQVEEKHA